ncbi:postacrosomal sheath WW domain-binding protein isoform X2 [Mustela erminea]|uniref:postacrosomal sheath WW domain-binding protein isoform X2 n=1 Tax=Mustela erminea TaxID=36723 RepID=UPI0013870EDE|nr:postacrosomal sheath WW domain-binding protein isoform X2 [Mustela erminea]
MAVNQSHTENRRGAIIPFGESVLTQCQDVELSFPQQPEGSSVFCGTKRGTVFLTSYRVIFVTSHTVNDSMCSFMMPFDLMSNCTVEQPVFTPNFIKGIIQAAPDGGWEGQATFKLAFRKGGAIEFAQMMMKAASAAARGVPLGSLNYWFSSPGLYVVTGQGGMCSQQMPCPAYPFVVYGPPQAGYGPAQAGYGSPQAGYTAAQAGYGPSPAVYGTPQDTDPYQLEMKLHWPEMKTHPRQMKPRLRHTEFHLSELELGLADLWQRSLLGMSLLFPLLHLLSPIYNLLGNNH